MNQYVSLVRPLYPFPGESIYIVDIKNPYEPKLLDKMNFIKNADEVDLPLGYSTALAEKDGIIYLANQKFGFRNLQFQSEIIEFIDNQPDYSLGGDEDTPEFTDDDSDNFFLRQDGDYKNLDIYYRIILPDNKKVNNVKINIYAEDTVTVIATLDGQNSNGIYSTGDYLHVVWKDARDGDEFREIGFYRVELEVQVEGEEEKIKTPIDDADPAMPGWQCPQEGMAIHDLVYKHRPEVYVGEGEDVAPNGPIYPFSSEVVANYRLRRAGLFNGDGGPVWPELAENYSVYGEFPLPGDNFYNPETSDYIYPVLQASVENDPGGVEEHYIDIEDNNRRSTFGDPYLHHRGHPNKDQDKYETNNTHSNYIFIQYWMYSTSSHGPYGIIGFDNTFTHEADWEMVQIALQLKDPSQFYEKAKWVMPWAATASQHYYGQTLAWQLNENGADSTRQGQRYVQLSDDIQEPYRFKIFIAENAHATYFRDGDIDADIFETAGGKQVQYNADISYAYDRISAAEKIDEYSLMPLEEKDLTGIYDWQGKWGQKGSTLLTRPLIPWTPGPMYRYAKDEQVDKFSMDADPVRFHDRCRKLINDSPDTLTELK